MKAVLAFRALFVRQSKGFSIALVLSLVTVAAGVALLGTSGWFITAAALTTAGLAFNIFTPSSLVRGFSFIRILARYGERLAGHDATLSLLSDIRGWLFSRLFPRLPLSSRSLRHGDLVSRLTADVDALDTAFLVAIGPITAALIVGAVLTGVLAWLLPEAAWLYGACMAMAVLLVPAVLMLVSRRAGQAVVDCASDARAAVLDGIAGHADLTLYGVLGTAQAGFRTQAVRLGAARRQLVGLTANAGFAVQALAAFALVGTLWIGLQALHGGRIEGPVLAGLLLAVIGSFEATSAIVRSVGKLSTAIAAAGRLLEIGEAPIVVADPVAPTRVGVDTDLRISDVSFAYDHGPMVLRGIDLSIPAGEHLAIIGPSGSGKSSLLALLLRLADPQQGIISLGGVPIADLRQAELHTKIALLSQDSPLFHDTIRANLLIARPQADDAALWSVLEAAGIAAFVRTLPAGLDTLLGEGGSTVSVGQGRRLCLARTLLSEAPILLLDEPTNALDREAELAFFATLREAARGRTVIVVTHAAIPDGVFNRVLEMRDGVPG
jgi:ATP-binding cassette subfamily C protein CydC